MERGVEEKSTRQAILKINSYHPNIKLTIETTSSIFLDTRTK